jgi:hypothetical protein
MAANRSNTRVAAGVDHGDSAVRFRSLKGQEFASAIGTHKLLDAITKMVSRKAKLD